MATKNIPTRDEIEYQLMVIFNRVEMKPDIKKAATYILGIIKELTKKTTPNE